MATEALRRQGHLALVSLVLLGVLGYLLSQAQNLESALRLLGRFFGRGRPSGEDTSSSLTIQGGGLGNTTMSGPQAGRDIIINNHYAAPVTAPPLEISTYFIQESGANVFSRVESVNNRQAGPSDLVEFIVAVHFKLVTNQELEIVNLEIRYPDHNPVHGRPMIRINGRDFKTDSSYRLQEHAMLPARSNDIQIQRDFLAESSTLEDADYGTVEILIELVPAGQGLMRLLHIQGKLEPLGRFVTEKESLSDWISDGGTF